LGKPNDAYIVHCVGRVSEVSRNRASFAIAKHVMKRERQIKLNIKSQVVAMQTEMCGQLKLMQHKI
jgi:hypothetical protein